MRIIDFLLWLETFRWSLYTAKVLEEQIFPKTKIILILIKVCLLIFFFLNVW